MIKPIEIIEVQPFYLVCKFNNGEIKKILIEPILKSQNNKLAEQKILDTKFFITVQLGELGQIYWDNAAQMIDKDGKLISCEYDMSPEFVYANSVSYK
jgi:hypothetical protein